MTKMRPLEVKSSMCAVPLCCESPFKGPLCYRHSWYQAFGKFLMTIASILALFLAFAALMTLSGCGTTGPSKARLRELLAQCRDANRQRVKVIKEYEAADCRVNPAQDFGTINFGEAGN